MGTVFIVIGVLLGLGILVFVICNFGEQIALIGAGGTLIVCVLVIVFFTIKGVLSTTQLGMRKVYLEAQESGRLDGRSAGTSDAFNEMDSYDQKLRDEKKALEKKLSDDKQSFENQLVQKENAYKKQVEQAFLDGKKKGSSDMRYEINQAVDLR